MPGSEYRIGRGLYMGDEFCITYDGWIILHYTKKQVVRAYKLCRKYKHNFYILILSISIKLLF